MHAAVSEGLLESSPQLFASEQAFVFSPSREQELHDPHTQSAAQVVVVLPPPPVPPVPPEDAADVVKLKVPLVRQLAT